MAEERNLGVARAAESEDTDSTKAELQRRMEEARESITQTVTEIKDTVANQYHAVKDTVTEALDWREQYRKRPVAFSVGALSAGFILGYAVAGTFKGDGSAYEDEAGYPSYEESDAFATTGATPAKLSSASAYEAESRALRRPASYNAASQPAAGGSYGSTQYAKAPPMQAETDASVSAPEEEAEPDKPGLIERFKETRAYDKLQEEVGALGDRFIEELSSVGRNVVLPALFSKVRELFGVDLSSSQGRTAQAQGRQASSGRAATGGAANASGPANASSASAGAGGSGGGGGASSYATSENRDYTASSPDRT